MGGMATHQRCYPCVVPWCSALSLVEGGYCAVHKNTPTYQPVDEESSVPKCCACRGTGECQTCDGDGKCHACEGECPDCMCGDGKCRACNGTGKHPKVKQ